MFSKTGQKWIDGVDSIIIEAHSKLTRRFAERLEYELRGAYRAGYNYLHVHQEPVSAPPTFVNPLGGKTYFVPAYSAQPPFPNHNTQTYDLTEIDPAEYQHAIHTSC